MVFKVYFRRTPHPVIVTLRDTEDYSRVLLYSYYTTITGWVVLLTYTADLGSRKLRARTHKLLFWALVLILVGSVQ